MHVIRIDAPRSKISVIGTKLAKAKIAKIQGARSKRSNVHINMTPEDSIVRPWQTKKTSNVIFRRFALPANLDGMGMSKPFIS